jgi:tRNA threonylcarbamoyladenosine biosynthesis protein TsaE
MVLPERTITKSAKATQTLGEAIGRALLAEGERYAGKKARILCLWGELGSGKTTFVQGIARGMGITDRLLSPTFIIVRHYKIPQQSGLLYHLDLYRMMTAEDVHSVGITDLFDDPQSVVIIEWPERLGDLLPKQRTDFFFATQADDTHIIEGSNHE